MTARMCATERGAKPVELTPARHRLHNGYRPDTDPAPSKITGCDICGRTRHEMRRATPIVGPFGRLVVCSRCLGVLTTRPPRFSKLLGKVKGLKGRRARAATRPVALPEVRCSVSLHKGPGAPAGGTWEPW